MQKWRVNKEQAHKVTSIKQLCKTMICGAHESHINRESVQGNDVCIYEHTLQLKDFRASKMKTESPVKFLQNYPPEKRMTPTQMRKAKKRKKKKKWRKRKKRQWQRKKKKWRKRKKRQRQSKRKKRRQRKKTE